MTADNPLLIGTYIRWGMVPYYAWRAMLSAFAAALVVAALPKVATRRVYEVDL